MAQAERSGTPIEYYDEDEESGQAEAPAEQPAPEGAEAPAENIVTEAVKKARAATSHDILEAYTPKPEQSNEAPPWAVVPKGLRFPRGRQVLFWRFPSDWSDAPKKGIPDERGKLFRQAICWTLSSGDEKIAVGRALQDPNRIVDEMTRVMIRAIDGEKIDDADPNGANLELWWAEIGRKGRNTLARIFIKLHNLTADEMTYFLEHCVAVRTAGSA